MNKIRIKSYRNYPVIKQVLHSKASLLKEKKPNKLQNKCWPLPMQLRHLEKSGICKSKFK